MIQIETESNHLFELNIGTILGLDYVENNNKISEILKVTTMALIYDKQINADIDTFLKANKIEHFEDIVKMYPANYYNNKRKLDLNKKYKTYHFWIEEYITPNDLGYDFFFAYKLKQMNLLKIDAFLNYQLEKYFDDDAQEFNRFLTLCYRKFKDVYIDQSKIDTINEWKAIKEEEIKFYSKITYTGDKTHFLKLMYSLYHAGLINHGKGPKIKTFKEISKFFNVDYLDDDTTIYKSKSESKKMGYNKYKFVKEIVTGFKIYHEK